MTEEARIKLHKFYLELEGMGEDQKINVGYVKREIKKVLLTND